MGAKVSIKGREIAYKFDSAGANRALELLGRELGMFVDEERGGHEHPGDLRPAGDRGGLGGQVLPRKSRAPIDHAVPVTGGRR